jgi:hypothetical protein
MVVIITQLIVTGQYVEGVAHLRGTEVQEWVLGWLKLNDLINSKI